MGFQYEVEVTRRGRTVGGRPFPDLTGGEPIVIRGVEFRDEILRGDEVTIKGVYIGVVEGKVHHGELQSYSEIHRKPILKVHPCPQDDEEWERLRDQYRALGGEIECLERRVHTVDTELT